jgi:hypothetical protein
MKFAVKRYWEVCDRVEVEADSAEEAIALAHDEPLDAAKAEYVSDSLQSDPECDVQPLPMAALKQYEGRREGYAAIVTVDGKRLKPRWDLCNHSPSGLEWGYPGSGPAQLALAILADHCGDEQALRFHQRFKWAVIVGLPKRGWKLTSREIDEAMRRLRNAESRSERATQAQCDVPQQ